MKVCAAHAKGMVLELVYGMKYLGMVFRITEHCKGTCKRNLSDGLGFNSVSLLRQLAHCTFLQDL